MESTEYTPELMRRVKETMGGQLPNQSFPPGLIGAGTPVAMPLNEQIRGIVDTVAEAADLVAQHREQAQQAARRLAESEASFSDLAGRLAEMLARHKAVGDVNAPKNLLR